MVVTKLQIQSQRFFQVIKNVQNEMWNLTQFITIYGARRQVQVCVHCAYRLQALQRMSTMLGFFHLQSSKFKIRKKKHSLGSKIFWNVVIASLGEMQIKLFIIRTPSVPKQQFILQSGLCYKKLFKASKYAVHNSEWFQIKSSL